MVSKNAILIVFGALVLTVGFVLFLTFSVGIPNLASRSVQHQTPTPAPSPQETPLQTPTPTPTSTPITATGNIDEAIAIIMEESTGESASLKEGERETDEITTESKVLVDFSHAYDEKQIPVKNFCKDIATTGTKITDHLAELQTQMDSVRSARDQRLIESRAAGTSERTQNRTRVNALRADQMQALEARVKTDTQAKAAAAFKNSVSVAIANRRGAIDAAVSIFQKGIDHQLTSRKGSVDSALVTFKTSIYSLIFDAKNSCVMFIDSESYQKIFVDGLKKARIQMEADRVAVEKVQVPIETLLSARRSAIIKAESGFSAAISKARVAVKIGFGESLTNSTATSTATSTH